MELALKWRQVTVRALLLGKDALLRTVMGHLKSIEVSAEVLAESGLLILLGAEQAWIRAGIGVERNILLEKWKEVLSRAYSNDVEWMQKCKTPPFRGLPFHDFEVVVNTMESWLKQGREMDQLVRYRQMALQLALLTSTRQSRWMASALKICNWKVDLGTLQH